MLNWLAGYVAKFRVQDLTSGFRAIKAELAQSLLYLLPNTYSYPTTMTLGVLRNGKPEVSAHRSKTEKKGEKQYKHNPRWCEGFYDNHQDMRTLFTLQDLSASQFFYFPVGVYLLSCYLFYLRPVYKHERPALYNLYNSIFYGDHIRTDNQMRYEKSESDRFRNK
jgi:hypothetical protein